MVKRLNWIDSSRGILIILVVIGHITYWGQKYAHTNAYDFVGILNFALLPYYMPAFFIITGFVSNFNMPFLKFFRKNFLSLIVPNIFLGGIFNNWSKLFLNDGINFFNFLNLDYVHLLFTGGGWFLSALFLSKLIYWVYENHFKINIFIDMFFFSLIFISGVILYKLDILNLWSYQHALILTPFLLIGKMMRKKERIFENKTFLLWGGGFFILMFFVQHYGIKYPFVNSNPFLPLKSCFLVIPISIIGTTTIFCISQKLTNCKWLTTAGRHSLTIYLLHSSIAIFLLRHSLIFINQNSAFILRAFAAITIIILTTVICILLDVFIDKHFPILKGKYHKV